jgi:hypothetical protein
MYSKEINFSGTLLNLKYLRKLWDDHPLFLIVLAAMIVRMVAVIFSKGWGMFDDHFLVIESSQSWVDGTDYNNWLPSSKRGHPSGHSWFYPGLHYLIFLFLKLININDPQAKMLLIRLIHAFFSLIVVIYGYKITMRLSDKQTARITGLLLALLWFMPFLSVRNLVEVVCIPFLVYGTWLFIKIQKKPFTNALLSGIIMGLGLSIRFQSVFFIFGFGLALILLKKWKEALIYSSGVIISFAILQSYIDYFFWGYPFAEFKEYVIYNLNNAYNYITGPWYNYILLILGILFPPVSLMLFFGFFRCWRRQLLLFLPAFIFLLFHSYFPNKQERFILPIVPFIIITGMIGWNDFIASSKFWTRHTKLLRNFWIFFWTLNLILLPIVSTTYSKKARVESMCYLSKYPHIRCLLAEDTNDGKTILFPRFYLKQWNISEYELIPGKPVKPFMESMKKSNPGNEPRFVIFFGFKNLDNRIDSVKMFLPNIEYETTIEPGLIDKILYRLNPHNSNETLVIYRNKDFFPVKK